MAIGRGIHWVGVFLLFVSSVLLLITTISAPVVNGIGLLRVNSASGLNSVNFGTFGYCVFTGGATDACTKSHVGYDPASLLQELDRGDFENIADGTAKALTRVMVLHPVGAAVAFIAFLLSAGAGMLGSFAGAMVAFVAWLITLVALACDLTLFGIIRHYVDDNTTADSHFGIALWTLVAAFVTLFLGMIIVFFTCCTRRREKKRAVPVEKEEPPRRRKKFGIF